MDCRSSQVWHFEFAHFQFSRNSIGMGGDGWGCDNGVELDLVPPSNVPASQLWATHGAETKFVFGTEVGPDGLGPPFNTTHCPFTAAEKQLSQRMMKYWTNFAKFSDPNGLPRDDESDSSNGNNSIGALLPAWPQYATQAGGATQRLVDGAVDGVALGMITAAHSKQCAFWEAYFPI